MKIIILGGTGFLGAALSRSLADSSHEVIVVGRNLARQRDRRIRYYSDTLDNSVLLHKLLPGCDYVFHLAADTTPGSSYLQPGIEVVNNILPTVRLLEVLHQYNDAHLVYISTGGAIYSDSAENNNQRFDELSKLAPISHYGAAKLALESFLYAYHRQTDNPVTILRPANVYGPGQPLKTNFGIIPTFFNAILESKTVDIWGDGSNVRDYLFIQDFCEGCLRLCAQNERDNRFEIFNLGSGVGYSINELCQLIEQVAEKPIPKSYMPQRGIDIRNIILDCSKMERELGWKAKTGINEGLKETWNWLNA